MTQFGAAIAHTPLESISQAHLKMARQGDVKAIALLLNRALRSKGVTVKVTVRNHCLYVMLESVAVPSKRLVAGLQKGILLLNVSTFEQLRVYGRKFGEDIPVWSQTVLLRETVCATPAAKPVLVLPNPPVSLTIEPAQSLQEIDGITPLERPLPGHGVVAGRYRLVEPLMEDNSVRAYLTEDLNSGQLRLGQFLAFSDVKDWKEVERFEREGKILSQLDHPGIPACLDWGTVQQQSDRILYLIQPLVEGQSIAKLVEKGWRTSEAGVKLIASKVLAVLEYLHTLRPSIVHGNICPDTLLLNLPPRNSVESGFSLHPSNLSTARVYLLELGNAWDGSDAIDMQFNLSESEFTAPELLKGQAFPMSDLYGLGTTLLFLLTRQSPLELPQRQGKFQIYDQLNISQGFAAWLQKMVDPDLRQRFHSATEALRFLYRNSLVVPAKRAPAWRVVFSLSAAAIATVGLYVNKYSLLDLLGLDSVMGGSIHAAAIQGDADAIRTIARQGGNVQELLYYARSEGAVEHLAKKGANVNDRRTKDAVTPLYQAIEDGRVEAASALVRLGADANTPSKHGRTPLDLALQKGMSRATPDDREAISLLVGSQTKLHPRYLNAVVVGDRAELIDVLVPNAALELKDSKGSTILAHAAAAGSQKVTTALLARGASVYTRDLQGRTPLHLAAAAGYQDIAQSLLSAGAGLNAKSDAGFTPLHGAVAKGKTEVVRFLLRQGADINAASQEDLTPLHFAAARGHYDLVQTLIKGGANLSAEDRKGNTAIAWAKRNGHSNVVELLKLYGGY